MTLPSYYKPPLLPLPLLHKWLDGTRRFDSHYSSFLFNHLAHLFVVYAGSQSSLRRSPHHLEEKNKQWEELYLQESRLEQARTAGEWKITEENWRLHLDKTMAKYPEYLLFFDEQLKRDNKGIDEVVQMYLPLLGKGLIGSALHGIIHLGFAVEADHKGMVAEGLANMCTVFTPLAEPIEKLWVERKNEVNVDTNNEGVIATALRFCAGAEKIQLHQTISTMSLKEEYQALDIGAFQRKIMTFNDSDTSSADFLNSHFPVAFGSSTDGHGMDFLSDIQEAQALMAAAYLASDCEFFIIHGLTSLHAVLVLLPRLSPPQQRDLLANWLRAVLAVYVAQSLPGLQKLSTILKQWQSEDASCQIPSGESSQEKDDHIDQQWSTRLSISQLSSDEHVAKGVYVLWRWTQWEYCKSHSKELFARVADNQVRPLIDTGEITTPHCHLWFSN